MEIYEDKRRHIRYPYLVDLEYMLKSPATEDPLQGTVVNLSRSGMSLFITRPLDVGQEIIIKSMLPNLAQTVIVRWIRKVEGCYKIGAERLDQG